MTNFEDLIWLFNSNRKSRGMVRLNIAEGAMLYKYAKIKKDEVVVEIGRFNGGSTALIASVMDSGSVYSIDIDTKSCEEKVSNNISSWRDKVVLINGDSKYVEWKNNIGLLFIDGDHTYEGVKADVDKYSPFVKKGGVIVFHDTDRDHINGIVENLLDNGWRDIDAADTIRVICKL